MPTSKSTAPSITIRKAMEADAPGLVAVLEGIAAERVYSAIDVVWPVEKQRTYLASLSNREAVHVAVTKYNQIVGVQTLDLWEPTISSMHHVAQIGTFLIPEWRNVVLADCFSRPLKNSPEMPVTQK